MGLWGCCGSRPQSLRNFIVMKNSMVPQPLSTVVTLAKLWTLYNSYPLTCKLGGGRRSGYPHWQAVKKVKWISKWKVLKALWYCVNQQYILAIIYRVIALSAQHCLSYLLVRWMTYQRLSSQCFDPEVTNTVVSKWAPRQQQWVTLQNRESTGPIFIYDKWRGIKHLVRRVSFTLWTM